MQSPWEPGGLGSQWEWYKGTANMLRYDVFFLIHKPSVNASIFISENLQLLQHVYLGTNELEHFPPPLLNLQNLRSLDLSNNSVSQLPQRTKGGLFLLEILNLKGNRLANLSVTFIRHLPKLRVLNVSHNLLRHLPMETWPSVPRMICNQNQDRL